MFESLGYFACGPVGLVHTHKVGIKYKKPLEGIVIALEILAKWNFSSLTAAALADVPTVGCSQR